MKKTIEVKANQSKRTFTLRIKYTGKGLNDLQSNVKYRTYPMNKADFQENENNTSNDWKEFLLTRGDYYKIL